MRRFILAEVIAEVMDPEDQGRFRFAYIFDYISKGPYPEGLSKADKLSLRKRAMYFVVQDAQLYYVGGKLRNLALTY